MHERTERALCRVAFLLLCALPTLLTFAAVIVTRTPWYHRAEIAALEVTLQRHLGVEVAIDDMMRPSPGAWQLDGVRLSNPETGAEVARVRRVFYAVIDGQTKIHLSQPELEGDQLPISWRLVHDRFLCQPNLVGEGLRLRAEDLSIHNRSQGLTLSPIDVWIEPRTSEMVAAARFILAGGRTGETPATLQVSRDRSGEFPRTRLSLVTGSSPLPCNVLAQYLPIMRRLGVDAQFAGHLRWELDHEDYTVHLQGARFTHVNMLDLFELFDHRVTGTGTIEIQSLTRHRGQPISEATGRIAINDAKIEPELLRAAAELLGVSVHPDALAANQRIACQSVAIGFQLYGSEVQLSGLCYRQPHFESMPPGTAIVADNRPLAHVDPQRRLSAAALSSTVDPRGRTDLPLGQDDDWARRLLPPLSTADPQSAEPAAPTVRGVRVSERPR